MRLLILVCDNCHEIVSLKEGEGFERLRVCPACGNSSWQWVTQVKEEVNVGEEVGEEVKSDTCQTVF